MTTKQPRFNSAMRHLRGFDTGYYWIKVFGSSPHPSAHESYRSLVQRVLAGRIPRGADFDACRAVLCTEPSGEGAFTALSMLLEGALADPSFDIGDTQLLVPLLKELARGSVRVEELL